MNRSSVRNCLLTFIVYAITAFPSFAEQPVIRIWDGNTPGKSKTGEAEVTMDEKVSHVNDPALIVYLPPAGTATGQAVIVCPGGGYKYLAISYEGHDVAKWFNSLGIAAFVLKYRMYDYGQPAPLQDAQRAIRVVRSRTADYGIEPDKIGIMGFSAGGHVAASAAAHFDDVVYDRIDSMDKTSARPDFLIAIYPVISMQDDITHAGSRTNLLGEKPSRELVDFYSNEIQVTSDTPPAFLVHGSNDTVVPVENSLRFYRALVNAGVPAELHFYQEGQHGFGLGTDRGGVSSWPGLCATWLYEMNTK